MLATASRILTHLRLIISLEQFNELSARAPISSEHLFVVRS